MRVQAVSPFKLGQRLRKTVCAVECHSADCAGIPVGSVGVVKQLLDGNRTTLDWHGRAYSWWVWNHGLAPAISAKLYTEL